MGRAKSIPLNPAKVLNDLTEHPFVKENQSLLWHLQKAKSLLPRMSEHQIERIASDELAGTIATIVGMVACHKSTIPVVMVTTPQSKDEYTLLLDKAVATLVDLGYLPSHLRAFSRPLKKNCFCQKRYIQAQQATDMLKSNETLHRLNVDDREKVCVQTCSRSCKYIATCKYRLLIEQMRSGDIKIQIYDNKQYLTAFHAGQLPKSRMTICNTRDKITCMQPHSPILRRNELERVLNQSEMCCGSFRKVKRIIFTNAEAIRKDADQLFALPEGTGAEEARRLLHAISERLRCIHSSCMQYQRINESPLLTALFKSIRKIESLEQDEVYVGLRGIIGSTAA